MLSINMAGYSTAMPSVGTDASGQEYLYFVHFNRQPGVADRILVLDARGVPQDLGTHEELLARGGWYAETWERQQRREVLESEVSGAPRGGAA